MPGYEAYSVRRGLAVNGRGPSRESLAQRKHRDSVRQAGERYGNMTSSQKDFYYHTHKVKLNESVHSIDKITLLTGRQLNQSELITRNDALIPPLPAPLPLCIQVSNMFGSPIMEANLHVTTGKDINYTLDAISDENGNFPATALDPTYDPFTLAFDGGTAFDPRSFATTVLEYQFTLIVNLLAPIFIYVHDTGQRIYVHETDWCHNSKISTWVYQFSFEDGKATENPDMDFDDVNPTIRLSTFFELLDPGEKKTSRHLSLWLRDQLIHDYL